MIFVACAAEPLPPRKSMAFLGLSGLLPFLAAASFERNLPHISSLALCCVFLRRLFGNGPRCYRRLVSLVFHSVFVCMLLLVSCGVALPVSLAVWGFIPRFAFGFRLSWAALPHPQGYRTIGVGVRICAFAAFSLPAGLALGILACIGKGVHIDMYNTKRLRWCAVAGRLGASPAPDGDQGNIALPLPGASKWFVHL